MIVVCTAEFAQSYIAHARRSRRPSPSLSRSLFIQSARFWSVFIRVYLWTLSVDFIRVCPCLSVAFICCLYPCLSVFICGLYLWPLSAAFRERQRMRGTGGMTCGVAKLHAMSRSPTTCSCGSHDGRLCQPLPPGKREERTVPTVAGSFVSTPGLNDARPLNPSAGTPMQTPR